MRKHRVVLCIIVFCFYTKPANSQWTPEKVRHKREQHGKQNDSAWSYQGFWSRHSFMGEQKLPWKEYIDGMAAADEEVAGLIKKYRGANTLGYVLFLPGVVITSAGLGASLGNLFSDTNKGETATIVGAVCMVSGIVFISVANGKYRTAVRLFNLKAKQGTLGKDKVSLQFGLQENGVGIVIRF